MGKIHSFHIPVMGLGYTIDTPIKVAHFGISSVLSIGDDHLIEKIRKYYCEQQEKEYIEITRKEEDARAKRITAYLNLVNEIVTHNFNRLQHGEFGKEADLTKYFELLSPESDLYAMYVLMIQTKDPTTQKKLQQALKAKMKCGSIDVNIMSKVDNPTFDRKKQQLPVMYNDAMAALRGYALSDLNSSIVISAGLNPRLFDYFSAFPDFKPDQNGFIKKKIILKVNDYRSALIQGRFLAKKGIWVSEFRIESGLNCGGHAFATKGELLGPILEEFRTKKTALIEDIFQTYQKAIPDANPISFQPSILLSAQGGVGTTQEHSLLLDHFGIDSVGWGTPFLLVPEAISIDKETIALLAESKEEDLYTSPISPLGVPFNTLKESTRQNAMNELILKNRPGSACPKKFLSFNGEFTEMSICVASRQYVKLKLKQLETAEGNPAWIEKEKKKVLSKTCLCCSLGTSALIEKGIDTKAEGKGVTVCPGPNIAYFSSVMSLKEMIGHIYGKSNQLNTTKRPHFFLKELKMYVDHFKEEVIGCLNENDKKQQQYAVEFKDNLVKGIEFYRHFFTTFSSEKKEGLEAVKELDFFLESLSDFEKSKAIL